MLSKGKYKIHALRGATEYILRGATEHILTARSHGTYTYCEGPRNILTVRVHETYALNIFGNCDEPRVYVRTVVRRKIE
jgi:hypothetical protein